MRPAGRPRHRLDHGVLARSLEDLLERRLVRAAPRLHLSRRELRRGIRDDGCMRDRARGLRRPRELLRRARRRRLQRRRVLHASARVDVRGLGCRRRMPAAPDRLRRRLRTGVRLRRHDVWQLVRGRTRWSQPCELRSVQVRSTWRPRWASRPARDANAAARTPEKHVLRERPALARGASRLTQSLPGP